MINDITIEHQNRLAVRLENACRLLREKPEAYLNRVWLLLNGIRSTAAEAFDEADPASNRWRLFHRAWAQSRCWAQEGGADHLTVGMRAADLEALALEIREYQKD